MSILSDTEIVALCTPQPAPAPPPMIAPFEPVQVRRNVISYGLSSYGYDIRCRDTFKIFTPTRAATCGSGVIDPKAFDPQAFDVVTAVPFGRSWVVIPPNSFALAESVETFHIPRDVLTLCVGKSTYARCGLIVNVTPFEPEWHGTATLEISNTTPLPARVYADEGIAQVVFFRAAVPCRTSYADRQDPKYQGQSGIVPAKV